MKNSSQNTMTASQVPHALLMVRPRAFGFNPDTAASNAFQQSVAGAHALALEEFDTAVEMLHTHGVRVMVVEDTDLPVTPDAVFPNNWFSTHADGRIVLYPMMAPSRRAERRTDIIERLRAGFTVTGVVDLSSFERKGRFLEGTGSIVFDHVNRMAYACHSPRTDVALLEELCVQLNYRPVSFHATDRHGRPVYHTNVMMWIGQSAACVCLDAIHFEEEQEKVIGELQATGHRVVAISYAQMESFAGNMMEAEGADGRHFLLMSQSAFASLLPGQLAELSRHAVPLPVVVPTIEKAGGGSIRCMVAGIHLPPA